MVFIETKVHTLNIGTRNKDDVRSNIFFKTVIIEFEFEFELNKI